MMTCTHLRAFHHTEVAVNRIIMPGIATFYSLRLGHIFQVGLNMGKLYRVSRGGSI